MKNVIKTWSAGGLGDAFIVSCKLNQILSENSNSKIEHIFVESNKKTCSLIEEFVDFYQPSSNIEMKIEYSNDYQKAFYYEGRWGKRKHLNTTWHGNYHFPGPDGIKIKDEFALFPISKLFPTIKHNYDVCIQVAAGTNSSRKWKFDVFRLRDILNSKGLKVALVGTAKEFIENENEFNFVGKSDLRGSINAVASSSVYVGLSGFHTYWSLAAGIPNVHLEESKNHNNHYIHESWEKYRYGIQYGSLQEVIKGLRYWKLI